MVEAKPHCGLSAKFSSGTYLLASSMRLLELVLRLQLGKLAAYEPEHHRLVARHEAQRLEGAGALRFVLE